MKNRFSALDVAAVVRDLQRIVNMRLQNIYDVNNKAFSLKFSKSEEKAFILIESGIRIHSTEFEREKPLQPSPFAAKLRKHLRQKRLTAIRQVDIMDRVVIFEFGGHPLPTQDYNLICELYDAGNIVLTNGEYTILAILRMTNVEDANYKVGSTLHLLRTQHPPVPSLEEAKGLLQQFIHLSAKKILTSHTHYPGYLVSHVLLHLNLPAHFNSAEDDAPLLFKALQTLHSLATTCPTSSEAYLYMDSEQPNVYLDVQPILLDSALSYETVSNFDKAADIYFSALETQKIQQKQTQHLQQASKKLISMTQEHQVREESLLQDQALALRQASLIESNANLVEALMLMVQQAVASGMDWTEIGRHIEEEKKKKGDDASLYPNVFQYIHHLELKQNTMVLELENIQIPILLNMSAMANARRFYGNKKKTQSKHAKTVVAHAKAFTTAQKKWEQTKPTFAPSGFLKLRKPIWFEKFHWCLSSDGYLMIAGKDMHQNERLVKKYLQPGDIYVHAELHGAPSVIVKKPSESSSIPPSTLTQAGCMALCLSKAWESKIVVEVWWVHADQVSKSAPSGEYLTTGSFMIRGRKNTLPPSTLVYGLGILFKVDEESTRRRKLLREEATLMKNNLHQSQTSELENRNEAELEKEGEEMEIEVHIDDDDDDNTDSEETNEDQLSMGLNEQMQFDKKDEIPLHSLPQKPSKTTSFTETSLIDELEQMVLMEEDAIDVVGVSTFDDNENNQDQYLIDAEEQMGSGSEFLKKQKQGTKHLSVAERRRLKKNGVDPVEPKSSSTKIASSQTNRTTHHLPENSTSSPRVRGKHGKIKKMKQKYGDQDEEDRALAMLLLKSDQGPQPKGKKQKQKHAKQLEMARAQEVWLKQQRDQEKRKSKELDPANELSKENNPLVDSHSPKERSSSSSSSLQMIESEELDIHSGTNSKSNKEEDEKEEEDDSEDNEEETTFLTTSWLEADSLTCSPTSEDTILYALPVCAPYASLQMYPLKVKLQPGPLKKGKAYKSSLNIFLNQTQEPVWQRFLKDIREPDWINVIRGGVKILAPQLTQLQQKQKRQKKQKLQQQQQNQREMENSNKLD